MKTYLLRAVQSLTLALLCVGQATSQGIVITKEDMASKLAPGKAVVTVDDTLATTLNIGQPGATSWDFSGLLSHITTTATSLQLPTPYDTSYPGATHVLKTTLSGLVSVSGIDAVVSGDLYLFYTLNDALMNPGTFGVGVATANIGVPVSIPGTLKDAFSTPDSLYSFPLMLGSFWTSQDTSTQVVSLPSFPIEVPPVVVPHKARTVVDAFGRMKFPGGSEFEALRMRTVDTMANAVVVRYQFLAKNGATVEAVAADNLQPDSGLIQVKRKSVSWTQPTVTSVAASESLPGEFTLDQNYPNPFNPSTTIKYELPDRAFVRLEVFNALGQLVATLIDGLQEAGNHEATFRAQNLPSGPYFYRLNAGGHVATRLMMLVK